MPSVPVKCNIAWKTFVNPTRLLCQLDQVQVTKVRLRQDPGSADPVTTNPATKPSMDPLDSLEVSPADKCFLDPVPTKCFLDQAVGPVDRAPVNPIPTFSLDTKATLDQAAGLMDQVPVKP